MDAMIISVCIVFSKLLRDICCFVITTAVGGANIQHHRYHIMRQGSKCITIELFSNPTPTK
jgi:hypothetical protein